jgi:hypothetical protein
MRAAKLIAIFMVMCNLIMVASAQRRRTQRVEEEVRIRKHRPTVYITFEGFGKACNSWEANLLKTKKASISQEQAGCIWLQLHNNTRWMIVIPTVDLFTTLGGVRVLHPRYRVEERNGSLAPVNEVDRQEFNSLRPGHSAFFTVLKENLSDARKIYIDYKYQWEYNNLEPIHRVEFGSDKLSKDAR